MSYINSQDTALRSSLITNFLIAELLASRTVSNYCLWLISPWVTNFAISLPVGGQIAELVDSNESNPYLFDILAQIAINGGNIKLVIRPENIPNRRHRFITPLVDLSNANAGIAIRYEETVHAKIYVGQHGGLYGSLNLTYSGVEHNLEFGAYYSDDRNIAQLQAEAEILFDNAEARS